MYAVCICVYVYVCADLCDWQGGSVEYEQVLRGTPSDFHL